MLINGNKEILEGMVTCRLLRIPRKGPSMIKLEGQGYLRVFARWSDSSLTRCLVNPSITTTFRLSLDPCLVLGLLALAAATVLYTWCSSIMCTYVTYFRIFLSLCIYVSPYILVAISVPVTVLSHGTVPPKKVCFFTPLQSFIAVLSRASCCPVIL